MLQLHKFLYWQSEYGNWKIWQTIICTLIITTGRQWKNIQRPLMVFVGSSRLKFINMCTCYLHVLNLSSHIFSSAWLCQQSSWNWNSSVVRPSVVRLWHLWSYCMDFFQNLVGASPGPYAQTFEKTIFFFLIFYEYFSFLFTWDPMGGKTSKCYSSLKSLLNPF